MTVRRAGAVARLMMYGPPFPGGALMLSGSASLGVGHDPRLVAQLGGIRAAKMTSSLIPLCHGLNLSKVRFIELARVQFTKEQHGWLGARF